MSFLVLAHPKVDLPYLESQWIVNIQKVLAKINGSLHVEASLEKRGTAIMVHKKILPFIKAVVTHGGRMMSVHLHGAPEIIILNTYCPQADSASDEKAKHYSRLASTIESFSCRAALYIGGDFNAPRRVGCRRPVGRAWASRASWRRAVARA